MLKKWWFWTIIVLICIIVVLLFLLFSGNINTKDNSNLSSSEVIEYLENEGYTFETEDYADLYPTHYIILRNDNEGIWIQKLTNELVGTMLSFKNDQINDEFADITSESANETTQEEQQYEAYENWLKDMGLTKMQLVDALDFYDTMQ